MALFCNFGVNHAKDVTGLRNRLCGIQNRLSPRNAADLLELAKNCTFLDRKLISALYETADGHELMETAVVIWNPAVEVCVTKTTSLFHYNPVII